MRTLGMLAVAGTAALMAGCYDNGRPERPGPPMAGPCEAGRVQNIVGTAMTDRKAERARIRAGARTVRVLTPGMAVTMDFRPDRLNIAVGPEGRVTRVNCG